MRAVDVFGLSVAALIALVIQIVQPYSPTWWSGMFTAGVIAVASGLHIVWNKLPKPRKRLPFAPSGDQRDIYAYG
jgi:hypothetical protein